MLTYADVRRYAPFSTYNYLADLDAMLQEREGESGATNLRWIAALRARDVSRNFKAPFNAQHALAQAREREREREKRNKGGLLIRGKRPTRLTYAGVCWRILTCAGVC